MPMANASNTTAPTQFIQTKLDKYAYRRFGKGQGLPLLCLQHFTGTLDDWDPAVTDPQCHAVDLPRRRAWIVVSVSQVIRSASFAVSRFRRHQQRDSAASVILSCIRSRIGEWLSLLPLE